MVFHALNRAVARHTLFHKEQDYEAFERVMAEAMRLHPTRLLAYCLMPNHGSTVFDPEAQTRRERSPKSGTSCSGRGRTGN